MLRATVTTAIGIISVLLGLHLLELCFKVGNLGLKDTKLSPITIESPLSVFALHKLDHVVEL